MRKHDVFFIIGILKSQLVFLLLLSNRELPSADAVSRPTTSRCRSECSAEPSRLRNNKNGREHTQVLYYYYTGTIVVVVVFSFILLPHRVVATFAPVTFDFVSHSDAIWLLRLKRVTDELHTNNSRIYNKYIFFSPCSTV